MDNAVLQIAMRYLHITAAIIAVGGLTFMSVALLPSLRLVEDTLRGSILQMVQQRFGKVVWASVAVLVITGVFNWVSLNSVYKAMGPIGNALIGTKVLIAFILFGVIWMQGAGFGKDKSPKFWLMIKLHLAAAVILLASILRYFRLEHLG